MLVHISSNELRLITIDPGDVFIIEDSSFYNIVEQAEHVLKFGAFPFFSITHGTYSKIKINYKQLSNSDGIKIVSKFNEKFVGRFITTPNELDLNNAIILSQGSNRIAEIERHLINSNADVATMSYDELEVHIMNDKNVELMQFLTTSVKSSSNVHARENIVATCVRCIRTNGYGKHYIERLQMELDQLERYDLMGMFADIQKIFRTTNGILRGTANNSLICFLLGLSVIDPIKFDLPFERFINQRKIYKDLT